MNSNNYIGSSFLIINLDYAFTPSNAPEESTIDNQIQNKKKDSITYSSKNSRNKVKPVIIKNQLGIVSNIELPNMK